MSMKIRIKPKKGISYSKRKEAEKEMKEEFSGEEDKKEKGGWFDDIKNAVLGKSFEETMKDNQKKNKAKLRKKK